MDVIQIVILTADNMFDGVDDLLLKWFICDTQNSYIFSSKLRETHYRNAIPDDYWIEYYLDTTFFQLFRLRKDTFRKLLDDILETDRNNLIKKKHLGGRRPVPPHKLLLVFLWFVSHQDTLHSIADRFNLVPSTVMHIINAMLYVITRLKKKYIFWPHTPAEFEHIQNGFATYPGVVGVLDGSHINVKVPADQHDSYVDRFMQHSINLMAICTSEKIFTYVYVGFPGAAHDSRVFSNSHFVRTIEERGPRVYFPSPEQHIIGDSAFYIRPWLITPYKQQEHFGRLQQVHNSCLSAARVVIENAFGILKGRFRRLIFINTYTVAKAVEITMATCVLHNFCYYNHDEWNGEVYNEPNDNNEEYNVPLVNDREQIRLGRAKRDRIARELLNNANDNN